MCVCSGLEDQPLASTSPFSGRTGRTSGILWLGMRVKDSCKGFFHTLTSYIHGFSLLAQSMVCPWMIIGTIIALKNGHWSVFIKRKIGILLALSEEMHIKWSASVWRMIEVWSLLNLSPHSPLKSNEKVKVASGAVFKIVSDGNGKHVSVLRNIWILWLLRDKHNLHLFLRSRESWELSKKSVHYTCSPDFCPSWKLGRWDNSFCITEKGPRRPLSIVVAWGHHNG